MEQSSSTSRECPWLQSYKSAMKEGATQNATGPPSPPPAPRIQKVSFLLRSNQDLEKKYFKPRAISLGPIHRENQLRVSDTTKFALAIGFSRQCDKCIDDLFKKVKDNIEALKGCYEKEVIESYNDEELAWLLLVDGCALLQYIQCIVEQKYAEFNIKRFHVAFADQDLFLLENQLPFLLLELLMSSTTEGAAVWEPTIKKFISLSTMFPDPPRTGDQLERKSHQRPAHLLQLLRERILPPPTTDADVVHPKKPTLPKLQQSPTPSGQDNKWHSFRYVTELKATGIQLKPSHTSALTDITFESHCLHGILSLPQIKVDDSTGPKLMNLIALEMCPDFNNDFEVTSYVCFLDSLIDQANDVKELRKERILHNVLGSDEEAAKLFNDIGSDLVPNEDVYKDVKTEIQNHYDRKWRTHVAQFIHDHFSSPWSGIAFLAAAVALLLTIAQTVFAVYQRPSECEGVCKFLKRRHWK